MNKEILLDAVSLIGEDLITEHFLKKNAAVRQKKRILRTIPIAAALMALAVIAVSLLPGMLGTTPPATTEREYLRITEIPGAVIVESPPTNISDSKEEPITPDTLIERIKESNSAIGTAENIVTVSVDSGSGIILITTFDLHITEGITYNGEEKVLKCISSCYEHSSVYAYTAIYHMLNDPNAFYAFLTVADMEQMFLTPISDIELDMSLYADYYVYGAYEYEDDGFEYFGMNNFDKLK